VYDAGMEISSIVSGLCDEADEFLAGVTKRDEARAGLAEWLTINYAKLSPADRKTVIDQALRILSQEGFFERVAGSED
jgi:hypothetical protein